jgi:hypothetical protein
MNNVNTELSSRMPEQAATHTDDRRVLLKTHITNFLLLLVAVFVRIQGKNVPIRVSCFCNGGISSAQVEGAADFHNNCSSWKPRLSATRTSGKPDTENTMEAEP